MLQSQSKSYLLYSTVVSTRFGSGSDRPLRTATLRIVGAFACALFVSFIMSKSIQNTQLPTGIPSNVLFAIVLTVGFILGGFTMLASGSIQQAGSRNVMQALLALMPLRSRQRWLCEILPVMIIWSILIVFGLATICVISQKIGVSRMLLNLAWTAGLFCGMAGQLAHRPSSLFIKTTIFIGQVALLLALFEHLLQPSGRQHLNLILSIMYITIGLHCYGVIELLFNLTVPYISDSNTEHMPLIPKYIPFYGWFLVKLWRNIRTRTSFGVALLLSLSTAVSILVRGTTFSDPYGMLILGAILASMFACDTRGTMKRNVPPEIVLLRGVRSLVKNEILGVLIYGIIIGLPMYFALHGNATNQILFLMFFVSVQAFSSIIGLLASTIFVPSTQDTGAQFISAVIASAAIVLFPRVAQFSRVSVSVQVALWSEAAAIAWILVYFYEIVRRKQYGRT